MSDRKLQDALIRVLADAPIRTWLYAEENAGEALGLTKDELKALTDTDPVRVERFARFLARHFYYERIVRFYKYSRALARHTGRRPETVLHSPKFDALLPTCVLGSRETAAAVAHLVESFLLEAADRVLQPIPYYRDLVGYEGAMLTVEAGPRVWRAEDERLEVDLASVAGRVEGTIILELDWDLPGVLAALRQSVDPVPAAKRAHTRLLVARSPRGQVTVMRCSEALARLIDIADGRRTIRELSEELGLPSGEVLETVSAVIEAGALHRMA